jgi:pyruvate kinase
MLKVIVTIPPHAPYIREVARHPMVAGFRLNTVMPVQGSLDDVLSNLRDALAEAGKEELWIDLKGRQLRVEGYWTPPFTEIRVSHPLQVNTPTTAYLNDGKERVTVVGVEGNRLLMLEGPRRVVGPGESINIPDDSLHIEGYLTEGDKAYIDAASRVGVNRFMCSFVEGLEDLESVKTRAGDVILAAKIESSRGLQWVEHYPIENIQLMAARGDLYVELPRPHQIIEAMELIIGRDPGAIAASRLLTSMAYHPEPSCADISDVDNLLRMGYRTLMLGDDVCLRRDSLMGALNLLQLLADRLSS